MVRSPRLFIVSLFVLALGSSLSAVRHYEASKIKTVEEYWADTNLTTGPLDDLLQDQTCLSSERYFLACTNAILTVANRFNLTLGFDGALQEVSQTSTADLSSERKQLEPWKQFYADKSEAGSMISFEKTWDELMKNHIPSSKLSMMVGLGLNGFISVFRDPHTYFMPLDMFKEVVAKADNRSASLGFSLGRSTGRYVIRKVTDGSPAAAAGLKRGDILLAVDGQKLNGLVQGRVSELLKGDVGAAVELLIERNGQEQEVALTRTESTVATVSTRIIEGIKPVAVIAINKFAKGSCDKMKESLASVNNVGIRGLLLDLRDNPGGQMEEAACITSLFVGPDEKIFEVRYLDKAKKAETYFGGEEKVFDKPMAVLVNGASASASEIVAGALRDLGRAVMVGEKTFGKGSFQEGELWAQNNKIAIFETKGFYYLPSGHSPQMTGLEPDIKVHFDNISMGREADQFMHPLRAPAKRIRNLEQLAAFEDCLETEESLPFDDKQLKKARQVLFCSKAIAGVRL